MQRPGKIISAVIGGSLISFTLAATADNTNKAVGTKVSFAPAENTTNRPAVVVPSEKDAFVFSAPPTGNYAEDLAMYQPIADYLTRVTGKHFVYRYADNWLSYSKEMTNGTYDLVVDGAALNGWRLDRMNHTPLVKLSDDLTFVTIARKDNRKITTLKQLAGQKVCANSPADPEMVALLSQLDNPARQPVIVQTKGWDGAYQGLIEGKCAGTVLPLKHLEKNDGGLINVLYQHKPIPSHTFSAGPRITPALQAKIQMALLADEGRNATAKLRAVFGSEGLVEANAAEYANLGKLLKDSLYYY
ncbi:MAG: PhnD/SsuA/transferrin family substrate-binding protein [Gammaproteobacteria bacterium]|nr:PhnD/SsuA/transferrin family substrate-binding protein [Gammaproteobacteria bacterium]